ncbi:MAG: Ig-like domain-containing protein, partial [Burkholderiales bacterium]
QVTANISQDSAITLAGQGYVVSWNSTNATSCVVDYQRNGESPWPILSTATNGSITLTTAMVGTVLFRTTCQGVGGPAGNTIPHTVDPAGGAAPTVTLNSNPLVTFGSGNFATITLTGSANDSNGTIAKLELYVDTNPGSGNFTLIDTKLPGTASATYSFSYSATTGNYAFMLRATDNNGNLVQSSIITVAVTAPVPTVTITEPVSGRHLNAGTNVTLNAQVNPNAGTVTNVSFYNAGQLIGTSTTTPYTYVWPTPTPGNYTNIYARATNSLGGVGTSAPITVNVNEANAGANIVFATPITSGGSVLPGATMTVGFSFQVLALSADDWVTKVELRSGSTVLRSLSYPVVIGSNDEPANVARSGQITADLGVGTYQIYLRAYAPTPTDSLAYTVTVTSTDPPIVTLSSPISGQQFQSSNGTVLVPIAGTAQAPGGVVELIEVLDNGSTVGSYAGATLPANAAVTLGNGNHALQLRARSNFGSTAVSSVANIVVSSQVTTELSDNPPVTKAGEPYQVKWNSTNAASCVVDFSRNKESPFPKLGAPTNGTFLDGTFSASTNIIGETEWRYTCQGTGGPSVKSIKHTVNPIGDPPTVSLSAPSLVSLAAPPATTTPISLTAVARDPNGTLTRMELFVDTSGGTNNNFVSAQVITLSTSSTTRTLTYNATGAGVYEFFVRVTDNSGNVVQSNTVRVTIYTANVKGTVSGIRTDADSKPILFGFACQVGVVTPLLYDVWVGERTAEAGGVLLASAQTANVATELDNTTVQTTCQTPGAPHHFNFDLSPYVATHAGKQIYVVATVDTALVNIACVQNNCIMPGTIRIGLTTPVDGDRYTATATVFMRARVTGSTPPYQVAFSIDNGADIKGVPDTVAQNNDVFYAFNASGLAQRSAPYIVVAKTIKDGVTIFSSPVRVFVDAGNTSTITLSQPAANASFNLNAPVNFAATVGGTAVPNSAVRFYANGQRIPGTAAQVGNNWSITWTGAAAGSYIIMAQLIDGTGKVVKQSARRTIDVGIAGSTLDATPLPVSIDVPHLTNPDAGTLSGSLSVSKDGAANYGIDIDVPPGTAGLQPKLSLGYSSQGTNGLVGLGWSLSGLSSVHRCGKTIAQDGVNERIAFALTDRLCLDGQRLVLVNQALTDANYWADNAEYRTEIDNFTRIRAVGTGIGSRAFLVESKDGRIMRYGDAAISATSVVQAIVQPFTNQAGIAPVTPIAKGAPLSWAISEVMDRGDNYIRFVYDQDATTGEHRPKRIRYGGKGLPAHAAVEFEYTARDDVWTRYVDEARNDLRSRLSAIKTYVGNNLDVSVGNPVRTYKLAYEKSPTSGRSLLLSVEPCATPTTGPEQCLPKTTFDWGKPDPSKQQPGFTNRVWANGPILTTRDVVSGSPVSALHAEYFAFADFNNDGRTDLLEKRETSPVSSSLQSDIFQTNAYYDANDKGRGTYKSQYRYFHNTGLGFTQYSYQLSTGENFVVLGTGDFNGDGSPDLIVETSVGSTKTVRICVSPLGLSASPSSSTIVFACGGALSMPVGVVSNIDNALPFVVDAMGNGLSAFYGQYDSGSLGGPVGATLCVVANPSAVVANQAPTMTCSLDANAPAGLLKKVDRTQSYLEYSKYDHISFEQMVDFAGTGKPNNVRWTIPYRARTTDDGGQYVDGGQYRWVNASAKVVPTDFQISGSSTSNTITEYRYPVNPTAQLGNSILPMINELPYKFDIGQYGSNAADFNGSGYSGTAFGYIEFLSAAEGIRYKPTKTEFTVCLSTGRALDCRVRKKFSGTDTTDVVSPTLSLIRYRQLRSVGQFEADGHPTLLMERLDSQPWPNTTGRMEFCRLKGDDSTNGGGVADSNFDCVPALIPETVFRGYDPVSINATGISSPVFFGDFTGSGRTQIMSYKGGYFVNGVWVEEGTWTLYEPIDRALPGQALDRIHRVTNGISHVSSVEYADGLTTGIVTRTGTSTLTYPRYSSSGVGKLVTRIVVSQGGSAQRSMSYQYQDAATDLSGRGSLGFAKVVTTDEQSNMVSTSNYDQVWPFTGMVTSSVTTRAGITLASTTNTLKSKAIPQANGASTVFTYVAASSTTKSDLDGSTLGSEVMGGVDAAGTTDTVEVTYDDWGNLLRSRTDQMGSALIASAKFTTVTMNTFKTPDLTNWLVGLVENTKVTKKDNLGNPAITREVGTTYFPGKTGRVQTQVIEPSGTPELKLTTAFTYDIFGNPVTKMTTWQDLQTGQPQSAVEQTVFEGYGRFPSTITNAVNHTETRTYSDRNGVMTRLVGPNLLATDWTLDAFGRVIEERRADGTSTKKYRKQCGAACPIADATYVEISDNFKDADRIAVPTMAYMNSVGQLRRSQTWGFDGTAIVADKAYDSRGRLEQEWQPRFENGAAELARSVEYDDLNRVVNTVTYDQ